MKIQINILSKSVSIIMLILFWLSVQAQSTKLEGVYFSKVNKNSKFQLKINQIDDSLFCCEFLDLNSNDRTRKILSVFKYINGRIDFLFSDAFMNPLNLSVLDDETLFVDSNKISRDYVFLNGKYFKNKESKKTAPLYSSFYRENYYYEYVVDINNSLTLYEYPVVSNKKFIAQLTKNNEVRMFTNLFDCKTNKAGLYYLKIKQGDKWISGWANGTDFKKFHFLWKFQDGYKHIKPNK